MTEPAAPLAALGGYSPIEIAALCDGLARRTERGDGQMPAETAEIARRAAAAIRLLCGECAAPFPHMKGCVR